MAVWSSAIALARRPADGLPPARVHRARTNQGGVDRTHVRPFGCAAAIGGAERGKCGLTLGCRRPLDGCARRPPSSSTEYPDTPAPQPSLAITCHPGPPLALGTTPGMGSGADGDEEIRGASRWAISVRHGSSERARFAATPRRATPGRSALARPTRAGVVPSAASWTVAAAWIAPWVSAREQPALAAARPGVPGRYCGECVMHRVVHI